MNILFKICLALVLLLATPWGYALIYKNGPCFYEGPGCISISALILLSIVVVFLAGLFYKQPEAGTKLAKLENIIFAIILALIVFLATLAIKTY